MTMQTQGFPLYATRQSEPGKVYVVIGWSGQSIGGVVYPVAVPIDNGTNSAVTGVEKDVWTFHTEKPVTPTAPVAPAPVAPAPVRMERQSDIPRIGGRRETGQQAKQRKGFGNAIATLSGLTSGFRRCDLGEVPGTDAQQWVEILSEARDEIALMVHRLEAGRR